MTLRRLILHNFLLKIFSVALGTVIWAAIHHSMARDFDIAELGSSQFLVKESIRVTVTKVVAAGDTRTFRITPEQVILTIAGEDPVLHGPNRKDIKVFVDLTDFHGESASAEELHTDVPRGVFVIDCKPFSVNVEPAAP